MVLKISMKRSVLSSAQIMTKGAVRDQSMLCEMTDQDFLSLMKH